jgi:hypothetical protein
VPTNFYDVIVLGDDLAGLIAAALCARRGMRVLVVETEATRADRYTIGPHVLPRTPAPFIGEASPAVRRVVAELNFIQTLKRRLTPLRPAFQVVLPDGRLEIGPDNDAVGRELLRELPAEREAVEAFQARAAEVSKVLDPVLGQDVTFPPDGFWERREIARSDGRLPAAEEDLLPGIPAGHAARALVSLPAAFTLPCDPRAVTPTAALRTWDLWRRSSARLEGGRDALRQMLLEKLRTQHAGEVRLLHPGQVVTRWGRAQGLALRDHEEQIGCQHTVCAGPIAELGDLFGDRWPKRMLAASRTILPTAYRYVLNLVISGAGLPEGISPITLCVVDPAQPFIGDNAFAIHVSEPDDGARVTVTVTANAPAPGDGENLDDILARLRPRLLARVEQLMPFCLEHTLLVHSPNQARPPDGPNLPDDKVRLPVSPPEPLWTSSLPASLGVGALPYDVGVKGVVTACTQNLLGLGLEGDFTAGWCAARIISTAAGKKKDYLKNEVLLGT